MSYFAFEKDIIISLVSNFLIFSTRGWYRELKKNEEEDSKKKIYWSKKYACRGIGDEVIV